MDKIDRLTVKKMMCNDPVSEEQFFLMYNKTNLFKRTRAWINLRETFKSEFSWLFKFIDRILGATTNG